MATRLTSLPGLLKRVVNESLSRYSDRQLLERFAQSGDEAAFAAIVDRHGPMLLGLCRRLLNDAHLADDVLQATFLVLARKAGSIRRRDSLASWLYGVAQRVARQARLAEAARSRRESRAAKGRHTKERDAGWDELLRILDEELQRMPERNRSPLLLCYLEGRTQDEAAKQLGWSMSTLRRRLESGRQLLRARMTRRGATLGAGLFAGFLAPTALRAALTGELRRAVLTTALAGAKGIAVPASITLLANGGMHMVTLTKIFLWTAVALTMGGILTGVFWQTGPAMEVSRRAIEIRPALPAEVAAKAPPLGPAKEPAVRRDRFNDPLPNGAVARLGTIAFRHGRLEWEPSLTFSRDGKHLVSTGGGWTRRWDLATGHAIVNIGDGWRSTRSAGTDLVTADAKLARICNVPSPTGGIAWQCTEYDLESGKERTYRLEFPRGGDAHGLPRFLSPDGKTYAGLNHAGKLTLWNAVDGTFTHHLKPQGGTCTALAFPPDGKTIVVGDNGHNFRVFDLATAKEQRSFGILDGNVLARMAISPDGQWLVTAGGQKSNNFSNPALVWPHDRFLRLWNLKDGTVVRTIDFPEEYGVQSLLFTPDSRTLIAGVQGKRNAVRSWDVASGKPSRAWTDDPTIGLTLAVNPEGKVLATMNHDGVIRLWDIATGKEQRLPEASPCSLTAVCFRPDGKTLMTVGDDCALREWETRTGRLLGSPRVRVPGFPKFMAGGNLLVRSNDGTMVRLHDSATGKLILEQKGFFSVVSPDGQRIATSAKDHHIRIVDIESGKEIQTLVPPEEDKSWPHPLPVGFTPDGQSLILQGEMVSVWDVRSGKRKTSWSMLKNKVLEKLAEARRSWEVAVSPDGSNIAFALLDDRPGARGPPHSGRLMVLETATGKLLHRADVDESIARITFSPDGKLLAGAGLWTVRVWDLATWQAACKFEGHRGPVKALAFSPDGRRLASASEDSTVLVWDVARRKASAD